MRKSVIGYDGLYEVDTDGNIFSLLANKFISQRNDQRGYLVSTLYKNGVKSHIKVHRIVAMSFLKNINNLPQINHIDGNKKNNKVDNLEWITSRNNMRHAWLAGKIKNKMYPARGYIGKNISTGEIIKFESQNDAELMGFDSSSISKCCKGTRKKHKGFTWSYDTAAESCDLIQRA